MRALYMAYLATLASLAGPAFAANGADESAHKFDLEAVVGKTLFLKCDNGKNVLDCEDPSVWENTNPVRGLQTSVFWSGPNEYPKDKELTP